MVDYNSGPMPGTDLTYEDFEAFLASYALTFACLEWSGRTHDAQDHADILKILDGFADRHGVQPPRQALATPRTRKTVVKPRGFMNDEMVQMLHSFARDFGIGRGQGAYAELDAREVLHLRRIVLDLLDVYMLAEVQYVNDGGERVASRIKHWCREENRSKRFAESVRG